MSLSHCPHKLFYCVFVFISCFNFLKTHLDHSFNMSLLFFPFNFLSISSKPSKLSPVPCNFMALICMIMMMLYYSLTNDYVQRRRRFRRGGSNSTFSILRKELRDGNLQSIFGGSSRIVSSSNSEPDPLLSSFMYNAPVVVEPVVVQPDSSTEASVVKESSDEGFSERYDHGHYWFVFFLNSRTF